MPSSAYSSSFSWGLYLSAMLLLVGALYPALNGISGYVDAYTSGSTAEGIAMELTSLRPGLSFVLQTSSSPFASRVSLSGHYVIAVAGSTTTSVRVGLHLPELRLVPGVSYLFSLNDSVVNASQVVGN